MLGNRTGESSYGQPDCCEAQRSPHRRRSRQHGLRLGAWVYLKVPIFFPGTHAFPFHVTRLTTGCRLGTCAYRNDGPMVDQRAGVVNDSSFISNCIFESLSINPLFKIGCLITRFKCTRIVQLERSTVNGTMGILCHRWQFAVRFSVAGTSDDTGENRITRLTTPHLAQIQIDAQPVLSLPSEVDDVSDNKN
jgi:hypothetical protein